MSGRDIRPKVTPPRDMLPLPVMLGVAGALGLGLFVWMQGQRKPPPKPQAQVMLSVPPPPLVLPVERTSVVAPHPVMLRRIAPPVPPPVAYMPPAVAFAPPAYAPPAPLRPAANRESALVIDNTAGMGGGFRGQSRKVPRRLMTPPMPL